MLQSVCCFSKINVREEEPSRMIGKGEWPVKLDRSILNEAPQLNDAACRWIKEFPIYICHESLFAHNYKLHVQPGIELNVTLEGHGTFVVDHNILKQSAGQLLIFDGQKPHQVFIEPSGIYTRIVVLIDQKKLTSYLPKEHYYLFTDIACHQIKLQPDSFMSIKHLLFGMIKEAKERRTGWQQVIISGIMRMAVMIQRCLEGGSNAHGGPSSFKELGKEEPISKLCEYVELHLSEDLSLKKMAEHFQLSPDHLIRTFKKEKGMTFHKYVLLQRIFESKRLLRQHPEMSLTDIAYSVGFASSSQFSKTFKSVHGQTPSLFRQQVQRSSAVEIL